MLFTTNGDIFYWLSFFVQKANTEIAHPRAVDDCSPDDVLSFVKRKAGRDAIVHDHTSVAGEYNGFLTV